MRLLLPVTSIIFGFFASLLGTMLVRAFAPVFLARLWSNPGAYLALGLFYLIPAGWTHYIAPRRFDALMVLMGWSIIAVWWIVFAVGFFVWRRRRTRRLSGPQVDTR
ncbi:MAG: hypothetical protein HY787_05005 [Deltaproteobacteria bacterium]|nr:hypothetical protein [Deltaproteobacteria bacterium]